MIAMKFGAPGLPVKWSEKKPISSLPITKCLSALTTLTSDTSLVTFVGN